MEPARLFDSPPPSSPRAMLKQVFGYDAFRGHQAAVIDHVVAGGDALVLMPTGSGKSICYQVPALCRPGTGIVVSPLIALMQNQVSALRQLGVRAAALHSNLHWTDIEETRGQLLAGALDLLYVAPERLTMPDFLDLLTRCRLALFAIDEAHCVSQWGHDFRPDYRQLAVLHERFPDVPRIALTATADAPTRRDIQRQLGLDDARVFVAGFDRPNITYRVVLKAEPRAQLAALIAAHAGDAGIVYCMTRRKVEETAAWLAARGVAALPYHAGLDPGTRAANQARFLGEEGLVMVATIAFGMGIDKSNVRFVAHLDLPKSLEAYYQETGRAGRDGLPATAWMTYGLADVVLLRQLLEASSADDERKQVERAKLSAMLGYCETARCRRQVLLHYFGETLAAPCGNCDTCLEPVATWDATTAARMALSAVYRTGQRFGTEHLIDVLRGTATEKVARHGHDQIKTYGVGVDVAKRDWQSVFRQLIAHGYLGVDSDGHGGLFLADAARDVLAGTRPIELRRDAGPARPAARRSTAAPDEPAPLGDGDQAVFRALKDLRLSLARAQGMPPYVIFHDSTLRAMVERRPRDLAALAEIPGVGRSKLERYGEQFLAAMRDAGR
ncbi:MAG TPA: DNA helicase RecQ [Candidatus Sulfotelmatobacter sp.]|nr:DNA helicase RecQ [Candidatus Sulfotelmatobacter sp.]